MTLTTCLRRRARYRRSNAAVLTGSARGLVRRTAPANNGGTALEANINTTQKRVDDSRTVAVELPTQSGDQPNDGPDGGADPASTGDTPQAEAEREIAALRQTVAELQRAKDAAEAADEAKTRYLVAVSHEIRSPLNAIYGYAQLLERDETISATEAGRVIRRSAEHLTNLVEGIVEISRIESGVLEVRTDVVEFPALLAHVLDMFRMQAKAKGIELRFEHSGRLPRFVRTDEKRLRQILINLLSNAIKYTRRGGVTLAVAYRSQVAEVAIADTGVGISPEDLEVIFNPFERGSSPEAALQPGLGLGLAITRALSRILGGEVTATSTLGVGSRFNLSIFLPEPFVSPVDAADYRQVTGYDGPRRTVLLIDDDLSQTDILGSLLRGLDFVVYAAGNGAEGLALADRCQPDLVLLDVRMPGISGWEVADQLRAAHRDALRIVMVSAEPDEARAVGENASRHDGFLAKPVDQRKLLAVIGQALQLYWETGGNIPLHAAPDAPLAVPRGAEEQLRRICELAKFGHIRAVEAALGELEADTPASAPAIAIMREYVGNFDLKSLVKMLDGHDYR